jgi:hypothetical protein
MQDVQDALEQFRRYRVGNLAQRQMSRCKGHAQIAGDEHHDGECCAGNVGKKLGMSCKRDAAVRDDVLGDRRRHERRKFAFQAASRCRSQAVEQNLCIVSCRSAGLDPRRVRRVDHIEARVELSPVADDYDALTVFAFGERITEFWPDARRLTGRDDEGSAARHI